MKKIRAIPTQYNGYKFRSRLEARWCVFFDLIGIDYEYEPEGFYLSDGRKYLPDFRVTNCDGSQIYYEVKRKNSKGDGKLECLIKDLEESLEYDHNTGEPKTNFVFGEVLSGDPVDVLLNGNYGICPRCLIIEYDSKLHVGSIDLNNDDWFEGYCFNCDVYGDRDKEMCEKGYEYFVREGDITIDTLNDKFMFKRMIVKAANKARAVRFEHGENPKVYGGI